MQAACSDTLVRPLLGLASTGRKQASDLASGARLTEPAGHWRGQQVAPRQGCHQAKG